MLEYKKTILPSQTLVQSDDDGNKRTATAVCKDDRTNQWDLKVEHPSGDKWQRTINCTKRDVALAMAAMLAQYEPEYRESRSRGHKPREAMLPDRSVPVRTYPPIVATDRDNRRQHFPLLSPRDVERR